MLVFGSVPTFKNNICFAVPNNQTNQVSGPCIFVDVEVGVGVRSLKRTCIYKYINRYNFI